MVMSCAVKDGNGLLETKPPEMISYLILLNCKLFKMGVKTEFSITE
jgi:hypothetical protein